MELTATQAERLWNMRRRRTQVRSDIEKLRQCEQRMNSIRESVDRQMSSFREASRCNQANWRGQTGIKYRDNRNQARTNAQTYIRQMAATIQRVLQRRSSLSTELTNLNASIRELERLANGGF